MQKIVYSFISFPSLLSFPSFLLFGGVVDEVCSHAVIGLFPRYGAVSKVFLYLKSYTCCWSLFAIFLSCVGSHMYRPEKKKKKRKRRKVEN